MLKKKQTILAKLDTTTATHSKQFKHSSLVMIIHVYKQPKKMDIQQFWIRYDTHMLLQQLLSVWTQPSEIATDPFPIQQGIKGGLEVMCAFEPQKCLSEVTPSPDLRGRTSFT